MYKNHLKVYKYHLKMCKNHLNMYKDHLQMYNDHLNMYKDHFKGQIFLKIILLKLFAQYRKRFKNLFMKK